MQPAGDHEVDDQPQIVVESNGDTLADSLKFAYRMSLNIAKGRLRRAQYEGVAQAHALKGLTGNARLERAQVGFDIRELGHQTKGYAPVAVSAKLCG